MDAHSAYAKMANEGSEAHSVIVKWVNDGSEAHLVTAERAKHKTYT